MRITILFRSVMIIMILFVLTGTSYAAYNYSNVKEVSNNVKSRGSALTSLGEGEGVGFYMSIYEDIVLNPNKMVEEKMKDVFGVDFKVNLSPPSVAGQYIFTDFFKNTFRLSYKGISTPSLKSSLISDCVRIRTKQAEDVTRRWRLLRKRLGERKNFLDKQKNKSSKNKEGIIDREILQRLIGLVDARSQAELNKAVENIPEYKNLDSQETLLSCYRDFSNEVDFELRLQSILEPTRKQMEILDTFMNGRLDDFTSQNMFYGSAFPRYDLLFDIDVIDYIIFGSPLSSSVSRSSGAPFGFPIRGSGVFSDYPEILNHSKSSAVPGPVSKNDSSSLTSGDSGSSGSSSGGFGTSTSQNSGPFCSGALKGTNLNLKPAEDRNKSRLIPQYSSTSQVGSISSAVSDPVSSAPSSGVSSVSSGISAKNSSNEGVFQLGPNLSISCEGSVGVDFGNDFLKLLFCINIGFEKVGKTWEAVRNDDCIACELYKMNEIFEEKVLSRSVRPHKNTGTIMESAICENGYGNDIGFHFFLEWSPVQLFPSICYPKGGDANDSATRAVYAKMVGYPEILQRVNRPNLSIDCEADFKDKNDSSRCVKAISGNTINYEDLQKAYLAGIDIKKPLKSMDDVNRDNLWVRLAGDQGVAERELHILLYRLGQDKERFGESKILSQDFLNRLKALRKRKEKIDRDSKLIRNSQRDEALEKDICLRGLSSDTLQKLMPDFNCNSKNDSFSRLEADVASERNRVMRITQLWNDRSRDFGKENDCSTFSGSGPIDAFWKTFSDSFSSGYYLDTDFERTQTPEEQITGQIVSNSDISDLDTFFSTINNEVESISLLQKRQKQKESFQTDQDLALQMYTALVSEFTSFRSNLNAFTGWWSQMVDNKKQFVSKGGESINVLQSFLEKL